MLPRHEAVQSVGRRNGLCRVAEEVAGAQEHRAVQPQALSDRIEPAAWSKKARGRFVGHDLSLREVKGSDLKGHF